MQPTPSHPKHPKPCPRKNGASCFAERCLFDTLNNEFAALELGIYGLCNWLKHFDEHLGDNLQLGIMVQLDHVKDVLAVF